MEESTIERVPRARKGRLKTSILFIGLFSHFLFDRSIENIRLNARIMVREKDLFIGSGLFLLGLLNFESSKFCDGNTADYLSCTRPSTYYYFDALDITCIVLGVFFILLWIMKRRYEKEGIELA